MPVIATRGCFKAVLIIAVVKRLFGGSARSSFYYRYCRLGSSMAGGCASRRPTPAQPFATPSTTSCCSRSSRCITSSWRAPARRRGSRAWCRRSSSAVIYVWIASVLFLAVCWMWRPLPGVMWAFGGPLLLDPLRDPDHWRRAHVAAARHCRRVGAGGREAAGSRHADRIPRLTVRSAIVRHPIYLGWLLIVFATPVMTTSRLLFAVISSAYLIAAIPWEERSLLEAFPEEYRAYQRQMPWRLIPGVW